MTGNPTDGLHKIKRAHKERAMKEHEIKTARGNKKISRVILDQTKGPHGSSFCCKNRYLWEVHNQDMSMIAASSYTSCHTVCDVEGKIPLLRLFAIN